MSAVLNLARWCFGKLKVAQGWVRFIKQYRVFKQIANDRFPLSLKDAWPCVRDYTLTTGFDRHYVYHTAWAARLLELNKPERHVDLSSCLRFVTIVSAFVPIDFYDYRPADIHLQGLSTGTEDLTTLSFDDNSIKSLSCMHVVEHIGLGRYGDSLDVDGDIKAIQELIRVLAPGGDLYFVVPLGQPRIQFNAHRIYSYHQITTFFSALQLRDFSLVPDSGPLVSNATQAQADAQRYGCGCFWFKKDS